MIVRIAHAIRQNPAYRPATKVHFTGSLTQPPLSRAETEGAEPQKCHATISSVGFPMSSSIGRWFSKPYTQLERQCLTTYAVLSTFLVGSCGPLPVPSPLPSSTTSGKAQTDTSVAAPQQEVSTTYSQGRLQYMLERIGFVEADSGSDSIQHTDSTHTTASISVTLTPNANGILAEVQIDSGSLTSAGRTSVPIAPTEKLTFQIRKHTGQVLQTANSTQRKECSTDSSELVISGIDILPVIPTAKVDTWVDTLESRVCRGGIPLSITRIETYTRSVSEPLRQRVIRTAQVHITGTGLQWNQKVEITGTGTATDTLNFGTASSRLELLSGQSQLRLIFISPIRTQSFKQRVTTRFILR